MLMCMYTRARARVYAHMHPLLLIVKVIGIHSRTLLVMQDILRMGGRGGVVNIFECSVQQTFQLYNTNEQNAHFYELLFNFCCLLQSGVGECVRTHSPTQNCLHQCM
jgi:hypothetical protein